MLKKWKTVSSCTTCAVHETGQALAELVQRVTDALEHPPEDIRFDHSVSQVVPGPYILITVVVTYR